VGCPGCTTASSFAKGPGRVAQHPRGGAVRETQSQDCDSYGIRSGPIGREARWKGHGELLSGSGPAMARSCEPRAVPRVRIKAASYLVSRADRSRQPLHGIGGFVLRGSRGGLTTWETRMGMSIGADDWVVHPQHGIGRVVKSEMRQFDSRERQLYYQIALQTGTLWVPVNGPPSGLRKMISKRELARYRDVLRGRPDPLPTEHRARRAVLSERARDGSFLAKCEAVRDLTALGWRKDLNESDSAVLRRAHGELCAEWAAAGAQSIAEARREIEGILLDGRLEHEG
jgi:RNA polymerase-interacting CarD/CdnL/TRCF family regulator